MNAEQFDYFVSVQFDKGNGIPLYIQLYDQLAFLIRQRQLAPGFLLPPVRQLAAFLSINPGTVVSAYKELERNGYILTRRGSGSFVADQSVPAVTALSMPIETEEETDAVDMSRIAVDPALFPTEALKAFISRIIDRDGPDSFTAEESQGYLPLREALAASLRQDGIKTDPSRIQIVSGSQQGIDIAARALLRRGSFVITEDPTYPGAVSVFRGCGAKVAGLPLTRGGLDIAALEALILRFRPSLLYVTPDIQVPTGIAYTAQNKARILALARRYDFYILEDDYASGLCYGTPTRPMKAIDTHDRVLYLRSLSSLFASGLRLAYLIMPETLAPALRRVKYLTDIATAGLTQRVLDLYLRENRWAPYVAAIRGASEEKMKCAWAAAQHLPPGCGPQKPAGGLSLWLTLPEGIQSQPILSRALRAHFRFCDGDSFCLHTPARHALRISFGAVSQEDIQTGFSLLGRLIEEEMEK